MPCPFPGMDPYLEDEKLWPAFQHQLVSCLYQILLPGLVDRYRARINRAAIPVSKPSLLRSFAKSIRRSSLRFDNAAIIASLL